MFLIFWLVHVQYVKDRKHLSEYYCSIQHLHKLHHIVHVSTVPVTVYCIQEQLSYLPSKLERRLL